VLTVVDDIFSRFSPALDSGTGRGLPLCGLPPRFLSWFKPISLPPRTGCPEKGFPSGLRKAMILVPNKLILLPLLQVLNAREGLGCHTLFPART
jgi:hypothetical protein